MQCSDQFWINTFYLQNNWAHSSWFKYINHYSDPCDLLALISLHLCLISEWTGLLYTLTSSTYHRYRLFVEYLKILHVVSENFSDLLLTYWRKHSIFTSKHKSKMFSVLPSLDPSLVFPFHLPRCILPDFPSVSSLISLLFFILLSSNNKK